MLKKSEYVLFTLPANWIHKKSTTEAFVRGILATSFNLCLGRCEWHEDMPILCTKEQFGDFVVRMGQSPLLTVEALHPTFSPMTQITNVTGVPYSE